MGPSTVKVQTRGLPVEDTNPLAVTLVPAAASTTEVVATVSDTTKTVTATGTPEVLGAGTFQQILLFPLRSNTGAVYFGYAATNDTQHGTVPAVLEAPPGKVLNAALIYLDVAVAGEGVRWQGIK